MTLIVFWVRSLDFPRSMNLFHSRWRVTAYANAQEELHTPPSTHCQRLISQQTIKPLCAHLSKTIRIFNSFSRRQAFFPAQLTNDKIAQKLLKEGLCCKPVIPEVPASSIKWQQGQVFDYSIGTAKTLYLTKIQYLPQDWRVNSIHLYDIECQDIIVCKEPQFQKQRKDSKWGISENKILSNKITSAK